MDGLDILAVRAAALRTKMAADLMDPPQAPTEGLIGAGGKAPLYGGIGAGLLAYKPPAPPQGPQRELGYREQARMSFTNKARSLLSGWWDRMRARYSSGGGRNAG